MRCARLCAAALREDRFTVNARGRSYGARGAATLTVATIASMAERRFIAAISPPKPINQMTAAEKAQFVNEVVTQIAVKLKKGEGS